MATPTESTTYTAPMCAYISSLIIVKKSARRGGIVKAWQYVLDEVVGLLLVLPVLLLLLLLKKIKFFGGDVFVYTHFQLRAYSIEYPIL